MSNPRNKFIDFLREMQIAPSDPDEIIDDNDRHRYRLTDDKARVKTGAYQLKVEPDGFAFGWAMSFREGVTHSWHSKASRTTDPDVRAEWKKKAADVRAERDAKTRDLAKRAADKAAYIWAKSAPGPAPYLDRKGCELHGARVLNGSVVVPMTGEHGLAGLQFIAGDGTKRFITGSAKTGSYFPIFGDETAPETIVICEGFATGAAIRNATDWAVVVAFDAGNLKPVAEVIYKKHPGARIIIGSDNDQWTRRQDGSDWNPGKVKAKQAALAIGGAHVIAPFVDPLDPDHRTDWDDILRTDGIDAVREAFFTPPEPEMPDMPNAYDALDLDDDQDPHDLSKIRPLGHNRGMYSFFPREAGQIVTLSSGQMGRMQYLYMLAPRAFWDRNFGGDKISDTKICAFASAHLMQACHEIGIFQPETTRGVGAWIDGGKPVVNGGDLITGDGIKDRPEIFKGEAVYESGPRVVHIGENPLTNKQAAKTLELIKRLQWKREQFAYLLAGWIVIAPIGGALTWRPHIWITGKSGAGKSSVISEVIKKLLDDVGLYTEGSTEARVRGMIGQSTRPIVIDEAESETMSVRMEIQKIISFARKCSSGGIVSNANASYRAQSCFCFAAINPSVEQLADTARISVLNILQDTRSDRAKRWANLVSEMRATFTQEYCRALIARTMKNLPILLENVKTFTRVSTEIFGDARLADQLGPMIAGAFSLTSTRAVTEKAAIEWMGRHDWEWHTETRETEDCDVLLTHIMTASVRYDIDGIMRERSIGDMVIAAEYPADPQADAATNGLKSYGIKVSGGRIIISNNAPRLRRILQDTPYIPWHRTLAEISGSEREPPTYFAVGLTSRAISIPIEVVTEGQKYDPVIKPVSKETLEPQSGDEDVPFSAEDFR